MMITIVDLKALLEAAKDDRTCAEMHSMIRRGCKDCERHLKKATPKAVRRLERLGFSRVQSEWPSATALIASQEALEDICTMAKADDANKAAYAALWRVEESP